MKKLLIIGLLLSVSTGYGTSALNPVQANNLIERGTPNTTHKAVIKAAQKHAVTTTADLLKKHGKQIKAIGKNITDSTKIIQQNTGITTDEIKKAAVHLKNIIPKMATILSPSSDIAPYIHNIHSNLQFAMQHLSYPAQEIQNAFMPLLIMAQQEIMSEQDYIQKIATTLRHFGEVALMLSEELEIAY